MDYRDLNQAILENMVDDTVDGAVKDTNRALNRAIDQIKELEETIEYQDIQLNLMAEAVERKNEVISRLGRIMQEITN